MEPYLHPRWSGINTLKIYIDGFTKFLEDRGEKNLKLLPWAGEQDFEATHMVLKYQIDNGWPIPCLVLNHKNPQLEDYVWHWFLLTGYDEENFQVKITTYGNFKWINFADLWDTGFDEKGGIVLIRAE